MNTLDAQIEAVLFFKAEPVSIQTLAKILNVSTRDIEGALGSLKEALERRGLQILHKDDAVLLTTDVSASGLIEALQQEELEKELSKAALETLSVILYHGPVSRSDIDYIRGVNSTYMLRTLLIRGLVERKINPKNKREHIYSPTFDLLQYLGVSNVEELPEYESIQEQIGVFATQTMEEQKEEV